MNVLTFLVDHHQCFPTLFIIIIQSEASRCAVEVGSERFFGLSGYVNAYGVRNYESLAMLATIMQNLFIDPAWVAEEYLKWAKSGRWKKENTMDSFNCYNLERIINSSCLAWRIRMSC